jgi:hypothetical protein
MRYRSRGFGISASIAVAMLLLARSWNALKKNHPAIVKFAQAFTVLIMTAIFLLS